MIKAIQAKPITGMTFSPTSAQESQSESVAAPAEVGQVAGTQADKPACRRGTCPADRLCLACEFPTDLSSRAGDLHSFQDFLISQKQSLSSLPEMAEKVASIDAALHELDLFLFGEGLA